jgi:hypothetical protein
MMIRAEKYRHSLRQNANSSTVDLVLSNLCCENAFGNKVICVLCSLATVSILLQSNLKHVKTQEQRARETTLLPLCVVWKVRPDFVAIDGAQ